MVLPKKNFFWNHAFIRHSFPSSIIGSLICDGRKRFFDLHHSAMLFIQNTCDFFNQFRLITMFIVQNWSSSHPKLVANESTRAKRDSGWAPFFGRSTTVTFSTFVGDELRMAGRFQLFRPAEIWTINMVINRNTTIRPQKQLPASAPNNTQLF